MQAYKKQVYRIVTNALAPQFHQKLVSELQKGPFSLIIDETTDVSTCKEVALVTRQYDSQSMTVKCSLYELIEVTGSSAEELFQAISHAIERDNIPFCNIIGFASDTTNVMFGQNNSVVSRLKAKVPEVFVIRYICHTAHLCASNAKLPRTLEELIHDIYNYFSHSAKRQAAFKHFQHFYSVEPHRLLRPSQTRWLSLHACVSRVLEQWDALTAFFEEVASSDNLLVSQKFFDHLKNPMWKLYVSFLDFALPKFTELNITFQSSKMTLHLLSRGLTALYREFLSYYMKESYWRHCKIWDLDHLSQVNFLPLTSMYMGANVALMLTSAEYLQRAPDVRYFLGCVQKFYIEGACQIKKRFPLDAPEIEMLEALEALDPSNDSQSKFPSLVPLCSRFPNLVDQSKLQIIDSEWRRLKVQFDEPFLQMPKHNLFTLHFCYYP